MFTIRLLPRRTLRIAALAAALGVACTHRPGAGPAVGPPEVGNPEIEPPSPPKDGPKLAPRPMESLRDVLTQTAAVVEGEVVDVGFSYDDCSGPRTRVIVRDAESRLGAAVGRELVLEVFGGPLPSGKWMRASELPRFALGSRYLFFLRNTDWTFSPVLGSMAYREETIQGRTILVNQEGQAVTGLSAHGVEAAGEPLTERVGAHRVGYRRASPDRPHGSEARSSTDIPQWGPTSEEIRASGLFARPALLPGAPPAAAQDALGPEELVRQVAAAAEREGVRLGGYLALHPLWRCWGRTPTVPERSQQ